MRTLPVPNTLDISYFAIIIVCYSMAIRTNEKSNSHLGRLRNRIRSTLFAGDGRSADDADVDGVETDDAAPSPNAPGNLFQCLRCGTVYIDSEKTACSNCDEAVEQVQSDLKSSLAR